MQHTLSLSSIYYCPSVNVYIEVVSNPNPSSNYVLIQPPSKSYFSNFNNSAVNWIYLFNNTNTVLHMIANNSSIIGYNSATNFYIQPYQTFVICSDLTNTNLWKILESSYYSDSTLNINNFFYC